METLQQADLVQLEGGGLLGKYCGFAVGFMIGSYFINPLLGMYVTSKAVGVCAIEAAVT